MVFVLTALEVKLLLSYDELKGSLIQCCRFFFFVTTFEPQGKKTIKCTFSKTLLACEITQIRFICVYCVTN